MKYAVRYGRELSLYLRYETRIQNGITIFKALIALASIQEKLRKIPHLALRHTHVFLGMPGYANFMHISIIIDYP